ncbi:MAG: glycosyltransferase family 4 protein [Flavobacteriaceae bacterium]
MHIAFLTPEYPHPILKRSGGLGTSIKNLAKGLIGQGVRVTVFVIGQAKDETINDDGICIKIFAKEKHIAFNWYLERKRIQNKIQKFIDVEGIQLIEAPDWTGLSAFMNFSVPLIIRLNGSDGYFCHLDGRKQKLKNYIIEKAALNGADAIVSVSTFTGELTKKLFGLKKDIKTIHNSIDVEAFQPLNVDINANQLLYFGTIIRKKGVLELAKAFNLIVEQKPNISLLLIGKDVIDIFEKVSTITLFFNSLSLQAKRRVTHLNEIPYHEIKTYIAKANVVVLPSFAEAFPMTWLETLAIEKALVSSNIGWANELMIDGKTGYTIDPTNHEEFASKLLELLCSEAKCMAFGKEGRKHVSQNFSVNVITQQNIEFYKEAIGI